jgi:putative transposase
MARIARAVVPGVPHHITQRGNFRQVVFEIAEDRRKYLEWLAEYAQRYGVEFWAYCLMSNHVHFIAVPQQADSLARTFNQAHMRYAQYVNRRSLRAGHLWQGRFFSCALDEQHAYRAVRYVELNPVRAGLVVRPWEYAWSSARCHGLGEADALVGGANRFHRSIGDWQAYLAEGEGAAWGTTLCRATLAGRPLGTDEFVARVGRLLGRALSARPRGRPWPKDKDGP